MSLFHALLSIDFCILLIALILCVIFGQVTVRKLRKNPETKGELGVQFVYGWDIFNVALALTLPIKFCRRTKQSPFGLLHADPDVIYEHTTRLDRILARVFYIPFSFAVFFALVLFIMEDFGFLKH